MSFNITWPDVAFALILLGVTAVAAAAWCFVGSRRTAAAEAHQRRQFEQEMASVELPPWNGDTYDWTEETLAYLADAYVDRRAPVPESRVSGPLPVLDEPRGFDDDAAAFIASMKAENDAWLARNGIR